MTLHSLLQLPFGCFVPAEILSDIQEIAIKISTPATILKEMRFSRIKLSLLRELELLIIDEVSMLRADLLDAIDTILRFVRRNQEPFGGLQIFLSVIYYNCRLWLKIRSGGLFRNGINRPTFF